MFTRIQTKAITKVAAGYSPAHRGLLQRTGTSGCASGPDADHSKEQREDMLQRMSLGLGHSFARVGVIEGFADIPQAKLRVSQPGDPLEMEADRVADQVMGSGAPPVGGFSFSKMSVARVQRQEASKPQGEEEKYKDAAKKVGEAFIETDLGKKLKEKAVEKGKEFVSTPEGMVITGAAAAGTVAAIVATNSELPIQAPEIPLDVLAPDLKMKITYEGPVLNPTTAMIVFSGTFGGPKKEERKPAMTESEKMRGENARMAAEQEQFRESLKTPEQKKEEAAAWEAFWRMKSMDPLGIPGLRPKKKEEETLQRKAARNGAGPQSIPAIVDEVLAAPGQLLDTATRAFFEPRFGHDFGQVRVHTDSGASESARAVNARAYTLGQDVVFGAGQYALGTQAGQRLLAHELTHVVQQGSAITALQEKLRINTPKDASEQEADRVSESIVDSSLWTTPHIASLQPVLQRKCGTDLGVPTPDCQLNTRESGGEVFYFDVNCDDLKPSETEHIKTFVSSLKRGNTLKIHGYASEDGPETFNMDLSCHRANKMASLLKKEAAEFPITEIFKHGATRGSPRDYWRSVFVEVTPPRAITPTEQGLLDRLTALGTAAKKESGGKDFKIAVDDFRVTLKSRIESLKQGEPLPIEVDLIMKALMLWSTDPGNKWGEGTWDSSDLAMTASDYATVPASQYKCNAYVAEVIFQSLGIVQKVHESEQQKGKYFPYRANEWGDPKLSIPHFVVVSNPQMGDIWSNGHHTGIYLGEYSGKKLYISARDDGDGVFALKDKVQQEHGVQIKYLPDGGVYRSYSP